jgi:hypothetical protein
LYKVVSTLNTNAPFQNYPQTRVDSPDIPLNGTQPVSSGTTDLMLTAPIKRATLHRTRLKFWMAAVNGGDQGATYDLETARGKVLICHRHGKCKHFWKLIYKWPPWSKIAPLGQLTPA